MELEPVAMGRSQSVPTTFQKNIAKLGAPTEKSDVLQANRARRMSAEYSEWIN